MKRDLPTEPIASPQDRWYVGLDQRLAHLLEWDAPDHWVGTRCGRTNFWPWFVARAKVRRCPACRRLEP